MVSCEALANAFEPVDAGTVRLQGTELSIPITLVDLFN
jgi:hypothetical protein